jgi:two-component system chemotaxis response regulator CheY
MNRHEGRILIVDDEPSIRTAVSRILSKAKYEVVEARDGAQAITILNEGDNPAMVVAIICDVQMPTINGSEAIAYFRSHHPLIPVVVLTGCLDIGLAASLMQKGVLDYLVKPVSKDILLQVIKKAVEHHNTLKDQSAT